jgi:hypothetical protein
VIDLKNLTAISQQGEDVLLELISERVKFRYGQAAPRDACLLNTSCGNSPAENKKP